MSDTTTRRAEEIRETQNVSWETACLMAERERDGISDRQRLAALRTELGRGEIADTGGGIFCLEITDPNGFAWISYGITDGITFDIGIYPTHSDPDPAIGEYVIADHPGTWQDGTLRIARTVDEVRATLAEVPLALAATKAAYLAEKGEAVDGYIVLADAVRKHLAPLRKDLP